MGVRMFRRDLGDGIVLRMLDGRHADELFRLTDKNREHLRSYLPWIDQVRTSMDSGGFIQSGLQQFANDNGFHAGIWLNNELAGVIGYHYWHWANRRTELGFWLGAEFQGQGLMTSACRTFTEYAFVELGLQRVEIQCASDNLRSRAIPERLGFTKEGVRRQAEWLHDHFADLVVYSMLRDEWTPVDIGSISQL